MKKPTITVITAAVAWGGLAASAPAAPVKHFMATNGGLAIKYRPRTIYPSGTGGAPDIRGLSWKGWNTADATSQARVRVLILKPNQSIAERTYSRPIRARVHAYRPRACDDGRIYYTRLHVSFRDRLPGWHVVTWHMPCPDPDAEFARG
jgi:hypothetical protein